MLKKKDWSRSLVFIRHLHAVGQGAFFTEQFLVNGKSDLNVIYDCGALSKKILDTEIERTFAYDKTKSLHVDVLFISHLDDDHFNGIPFLIEKGCVDDKTVVILPFSYPLLLFYLLDDIKLNNQTKNALKKLFQSKAKILGVNYIEGIGQISNNEEVSLEEIYGKYDNYSTINNTTLFKYKQIWYYVPFMNVNVIKVWDKFKGNLTSYKIDLEKLKDAEYVEKNLGTLKKVYNSVKIKGIKGVTPINVCSLQMISFKSKNILCKYVFAPNVNLSKTNCVLSCLFSGDTIINNVFIKTLDSIRAFLGFPIEMLQIPHHGRESCFNKEIFDEDRFESAFVNYYSSHKKNDYVKTVEDFMKKNRKNFYHITENCNYVLMVTLFP